MHLENDRRLIRRAALAALIGAAIGAGAGVYSLGGAAARDDQTQAPAATSTATPVSPASPDADPAAPTTSAAPPAATKAAVRITEPMVVSQPPPAVPPELLDLARRLRLTSEIDVIINEHGTVDNVVVTRSVNAAYDAAVVAAARAWRYRPATRDGVPIRSVKTVVINASGK